MLGALKTKEILTVHTFIAMNLSKQLRVLCAHAEPRTLRLLRQLVSLPSAAARSFVGTHVRRAQAVDVSRGQHPLMLVCVVVSCTPLLRLGTMSSSVASRQRWFIWALFSRWHVRK